MSKSLFLRFFKKAILSPLASQPILSQLLKEDRIGEQDAFSPRLTLLPLDKTVPAEDKADSRMALAFPTVTGSDSSIKVTTSSSHKTIRSESTTAALPQCSYSYLRILSI